MTDENTSGAQCVDCGKPIGQGLRCVEHRSAYLRLKALRDTAATDRDLLRMMEEEKLNMGRVATRFGISRTGARRKIIMAREREAKRVAAGI